MFMFSFTPEGGGGYSREFLVGVCHLVPQVLTLSHTKKCHFSHCFQTRPLKSMPIFRPVHLGKNYVNHYLA